MILFTAIFLVASGVILHYVDRAVPEPFIDEIFHVLQAQQYCNGSFSEWNDKITTPPGLYFASLIFQIPFSLISDYGYCSVMSLRAVNIVFNLINMILIYYIVKELSKVNNKNSKKDEGEKLPLLKLQAFTIALFPVSYFFSFLYYTDPGSTMFVLAAYLANLRNSHKTSAILGLASVFFRQTNIVWVLFMAGSTAANEMEKAEGIREIETSPQIKDKLLRFLTGIIAATVKYLLIVGNLIQIFTLVWPYICVMLTFACFVFINGGIVLGDKQNHEASFHAPQILYFLAFSLLFSAPALVSIQQVKKFFKALRNDPLKFIVFAMIFTGMVIKYTYLHIFILSDNRHYTFYLCRYFLKHLVYRLMLVPIYIYAGWVMNHALNDANRSGIWRIAFIICTCAVTIPQRLIEVRYFIIPYYIFRMNIQVKDKLIVFMEFLMILALNAFTLYVFLTKKVVWPDIEQPQRIIW